MKRNGPPQFEFTVIAGSLKGRRIVAPDLGITRPPLTRLRKSIFDFLMPYIDGARYLDLFSGTGSYLFEAISRGAVCAVGVEMESRLADAINQQAEKYEVSDRLRCLTADVLKVVSSLGGTEAPFDIVMIAPPQYKQILNSTLKRLAGSSLLSEQTLVICQHDTKETPGLHYPGYVLKQSRKYGNTTFTVLTPGLSQ